MASEVTYGQLKNALTGLGFREMKQSKGIALKHSASGTKFLFRPYKEDDRLQVGEVLFVRMQLDQRGLLESEAFEELLAKAPA